MICCTVKLYVRFTSCVYVLLQPPDVPYAFIFLHVYKAVSSTFMGHITIISLQKKTLTEENKRPTFFHDLLFSPPAHSSLFCPSASPTRQLDAGCKREKVGEDANDNSSRRGGRDFKQIPFGSSPRYSAVVPSLLKWWNPTGKTGKCVSFISKILL